MQGDVNAGLFITFINLIGGILIGVIQKGMSWEQALTTFSLLTIGDGLVSTIPSIIISVAAGMIVSRAAAEAKMGEEFLAQLSYNSRVLRMVAVVLFIFGLVPGLPLLPFWISRRSSLSSRATWPTRRRTQETRRTRPRPEQNPVPKAAGAKRQAPTRRKKCRIFCPWILWNWKWDMVLSPWWTSHRTATCSRASVPSEDSSLWTWGWCFPRCIFGTTSSSVPASMPC